MSVLLTACKKSKLIAAKTKLKRPKREEEQHQQCNGAGAAASLPPSMEEEAREWKFFLEGEFYCVICYPKHGEVYLNGMPILTKREGRHLNFWVGLSQARISEEGSDITLNIDGETA